MRFLYKVNVRFLFFEYSYTYKPNIHLFESEYFFSSLDHSIAVALIIWHFTHDKKQTLSGLFHDIATPVFKHCVDFFNGDYMTQESTEDLTTKIICIMEFEGVVYKILPATKGTSARGEWQRQDVVFEIPSEFSRKICVTFFNKPTEADSLVEGQTYVVSVNVESREYNGKWYTDVRAWRVQPVGAAGAAPATNMPPFVEEPQPSYAAGAGVVDDMPF